MQIRILAGCKRLLMAVAIASLIIAPVGAAGPPKGKPIGAVPMSADGAARSGTVDETPNGVEPILYARTNYVWPFSSGPVYGQVSAANWNAVGVLHTAVGSFDMTGGLPNLPDELRAVNRLNTQASQYFVLQVKPEGFSDGTFDDMTRAIVGGGGAIISEMPVSAFVVRMTPSAYNAIKDSPLIVALMPYQPAFKISPEIGRVPLLEPQRALSNVYSLKVKLFPGESPEAVSATLASMGMQVKGSYPDTVFVDADASRLAAIAGLDAVANIEEVLPIFLNAEETTTTIQTGKWNNGATPYNDAGIDGGGANKASFTDDQVLMIIDNGIKLNAGDLSDSSSNSGFDATSPNGVISSGGVSIQRKVVFYGTTNAFGGHGDLLGCDGNTTSGVTHGHTVAVIALGNATNVPASYGSLPTSCGGHACPWFGTDPAGNFWKLDGVAPKARLVAYDGQVTPLTGRCDDVLQVPTPLLNVTPLDPGTLYTAPSTGSLPDSYAKGARTVNFSWGTVAHTYDSNTQAIDTFLIDYPDSMVFVAVGNSGRDKNGDRIPDPDTVGAPSTGKNIISVGASRNADDLGIPDLPNSRWVNSGNGPATATSQRIAPLLMAPGTDAGTLGLASEFHCRSNRNSQANPVECDVIAGQISTSYASAAAAGAGLLVRDYFAQGFYPDGTNTNTLNSADLVPTISGALLKAVLVTSAKWMGPDANNFGACSGTPGPGCPYAPTLTRKFRGNREQGYGRIVLTNTLPLQSYAGAVTGLIVGDGGPLATGQASKVNSTTLPLNIAQNSTESTTINVCDTTQPLTIAIAWADSGAGDTILRDLNLEVTSPSNRKYLGNFFTDDVDDSAAVTGSEDCTYSGLPWPPDSAANKVDTGPWSLPVSGTGVSCVSQTAHVDHNNNVEAVFLSNDPKMNGVNDDPGTSLNEGSDNQIEQGVWTVAIKSGAYSGSQRYSIAIAGGVCKGSAARVRKVLPNNQFGGTVLTCNDNTIVTIDETDSTGDTGVTTAKVAARTKVEVVDANGNVTDTETFKDTDFTLTSAGGNYRFDSKKIQLTDGTTPESGNGALDVRDGQTIRVTYQDVGTDGVTPDPNAKRVGTASVNCRPVLSSGGVLFGQFGKDAFTLVDGGCEKDERGYFTFGFPDRYIDNGELVSYIVAFQSAETGADLVNASVSLRAVLADGDSPASCKPGQAPTATCSDPNRTNNNTPCPQVTVIDSPKIYGLIPAGQTITPSFTVSMGDIGNVTQKCDFLIGVSAKSAGKGVESLIAKREIMNADEISIYYSTDFPQGGVQPTGWYDINNNEILEGVTNDPANFINDYVFETRNYSDMTSTNPVTSTKAPWNFDSNDGGFTVGLQNTARPSVGTFAQWGEDKNYNGLLDGFCDEGLKACSLNTVHRCNVNADCGAGEGTCKAMSGQCSCAGKDPGVCTSDPTHLCDVNNDIYNYTTDPPVLTSSDCRQPVDNGFCDVTTKPNPCTQGIAVSVGCFRCSLNHAHECNVNADCNPGGGPNEGTCDSHGTCDFTLGEDRNPANGALDEGWSTAGGCGWQTKAPASATGGVWHTGLIHPIGSAACLSTGNDLGGDCQRYWATPNGDLVGDNNWWELLLTPVLHKVNTQTDGSGDPVYQVAITDWAWNMSVDIPDTNTSVTLEFDTDISKQQGVDLFNDTAVLVAFRGKQGARAGGNAPITGGFNMFARVSQCVDTDNNGTADHCGTSGGPLCNGVTTKPDTECTGLDLSPTRGLCSGVPAGPKVCTGHPNFNCINDDECNLRCSNDDTRGCQTNFCIGGFNNGKQCTALTACANNCVGGLNDGLPCTTIAQCPGGTSCTANGGAASTSCSVAKACTLNPAKLCDTSGTTCGGGEGACSYASTSTACGTGGTCQNNVTSLGFAPPGERCVNRTTNLTTDATFVEGQTVSDCDTANDTCPGKGLGVCVGYGSTNREGNNNCWFEGDTAGGIINGFAAAKTPYGLATPPDDDQANGYCNRNDSLNGVDKSVSCVGTKDCDNAGDPYASVRACAGNKSRLCSANTGCAACSLDSTKFCTTNADCLTCSLNANHACATNSDCAPFDGSCNATNKGTCTNTAFGLCNVHVYDSVCNKPDLNVDEFVQRNGPGRNYGIQVSNGPDMRFTTLEDFYGDTGTAFQAALGFNNREPDVNTKDVSPGFGVAVDDMVISWKETRLDVDTHTCAANGSTGECASIEASSGVSYEGNSVVSLTVIDKSPYDPVNNKNNCSLDSICGKTCSASIFKACVVNGDCPGGETCVANSYTGKSCSTDIDCNTIVGGCTEDFADNGHCSVHATKACSNNTECGYCSLLQSKSCAVAADCGLGQGTCTADTCTPDANFNDDQDCNNNGTNDVTVKLTSDAETAGEVAVLDETPPGSGSHIYKGNFPYSTFYDSPGTLFVVQSGTALPIVTARYEDRDDGSGSHPKCKNALEPSVQGFITAQTTVAAASGRITVNSYTVKRVSVCNNNNAVQCVTDADCSGVGGTCSTAYGDDDGFADANELDNLVVVFANKSGFDVSDLTATLGTNSANIECITRSAIIVGTAGNTGTLLNNALSVPANDFPGPFQFKVANVNRTTLDQVLQATFTVTVRSNKFDQLTRATNITLDLDETATGGSAPISGQYEDFESGFGNFTLEYLDAGRTSIPASNGFRCSYNDPFGLNSNSPGNTDCFLGFTSDPSSGVNDWHIHTTVKDKNGGGVGRAYTGSKSLHLGVHGGDNDFNTPAGDTTRLKHIMSVRTLNPVNIGLAGANPELYFEQQVSFVDSTAGVNVSPGEGVDRGVVEAKVTTGVGNVWQKLYPYVNVYDQQGTDDFSNCEFDPTDDGNNEDSFFDPNDPARRLGPSSTCFPEFCFVHQGQTDYRKTFDVADVGFASDGPGLQGCTSPSVNNWVTGTATGCLPDNVVGSPPNNPGTWVQPRFSLVPLAGKSILIRFLFTSIEIGGTQLMYTFFGRPNISGDDGWYIDDIHIDGRVASAATLSVDTATIASPLVCGSCSNVSPSLTATPVSLSAPGQLVTLSSKLSTVDVCKNGVLQYQFWKDDNGSGVGDGIIGNGSDSVLRDWTDSSSFVDAPLNTSYYGVKVRCSTDPGCDAAGNSAAITVPVNCPTHVNLLSVSKPSLGGAEPDNNATISWGNTLNVRLIRGDLKLMRGRCSTETTTSCNVITQNTDCPTSHVCNQFGITNVDTGGCLLNNVVAASTNDNTAPTNGAVYYLMSSTTTGYCNLTPNTYDENVPSEQPGNALVPNDRNANILADPDRCTPP